MSSQASPAREGGLSQIQMDLIFLSCNDMRIFHIVQLASSCGKAITKELNQRNYESINKRKDQNPVLMFSFIYKDPFEATELISQYNIKNFLIYHTVLHDRKEKVGSVMRSQVCCCDYCDSLFPYGGCTSPNRWTKIGSNTPILVHWFPGQHSFYLLDKISQSLSNICNPFCLSQFQSFSLLFILLLLSVIVSGNLYFIEVSFSQLSTYIRSI